MQTDMERGERSTQFRSPLAFRLVVWFVLFSLVPLLIVYAFMRGQVRQTLIDARLETLQSQARLYSDHLATNDEEAQTLTSEMTSSIPGSTFFVLEVDGMYSSHSDPSKIGRSSRDDLGSNITLKLLSNESTSFLDEEKGLMFGTSRQSLSSPVSVAVSSRDPAVAPLGRLTDSIVYQLARGLAGVTLALGIVLYFMLYPVRQLSEFANQIGKRNFSATLNTSSFSGELALVAEALIRLSEDIQGMIGQLEQKVIDRTRDLEYRAVQLRATADVSKAITSLHNLTELLQQATILIHEQFGYYHVGIFLLEERGIYAVLGAANSEGGRKMLEKGYRLKVGESGIVGYVTESARARIALDVGPDAASFDNPDLPNTRSEMALPLLANGQILGALDLQSTEPQAFNEEDISTLQALADQIAVAIQNVNMYNETFVALEAARQVYGEVSREAWKRIMGYQPRVGYLATTPGAIQLQSESMEPSMVAAFETGNLIAGPDGLSITLPIKVRGEIIGAIRLKKSEIAEAWSQDETHLAIALSDQLSGALESARLYRESQQRAARESLVSDISARISSTSLVESIVRETTQELGQAIGNAKITFQLQMRADGQEQVEDSARAVVASRKNGGSQE